jgi:hypothetical protein
VTCTSGSGCGTAAGSCADSCGSNLLATSRACSGCGPNLANGTCGGGIANTCDASTHTLCQAVSCGGTSYRCTNAGGTWGWRTAMDCDDGNPLTTSDMCQPSGICQGVTSCTLSVLEPFDTSALPTGWAIDDFDADAYGYDWMWDNTANTTGGSGGYWWVNSDYTGVDFDDAITSNLYQRGACTTVNLSFHHYYYYYSGDAGYVQIKVDGGTWQTITTYTATTSGLVTTNITPYLSADSVFRIRFRYVANYDWSWKIDDFSATGS